VNGCPLQVAPCQGWEWEVKELSVSSLGGKLGTTIDGRGEVLKEKKRKDGKGVHDFGAIDFACGHAADL